MLLFVLVGLSQQSHIGFWDLLVKLGNTFDAAKFLCVTLPYAGQGPFIGTSPDKGYLSPIDTTMVAYTGKSAMGRREEKERNDSL